MNPLAPARFGARGSLSVALVLLACGCGDAGSGDETSDGAGGDGEGAGASDGASGQGGSTGGGAPGPACPSGSELTSSALLFDGEDDDVTMGVAPELGLAQLTLEAWIRRDGPGETFGTGVGGLTMVPIAGKGRGEDDGSNVDCNYALGIFGDVLGADFEDMETGKNHPVVGATSLGFGAWHHVALTFDGASLKLYVDGALDGETATDATPRYDSIQHFGIGAAFNSTGVAAGRFAGAIDEVRVYDRALSAAEIQAGMSTTKPDTSGLVGRFALDEKDGAVVDSAGPNPGTIEGGAMFVGPGAPTDAGAPPVVGAATPDAEAVLDAGDVELAVDLEGADADPSKVTFYVREIRDDDDFTIVVMPDTQYYTRVGDNHDYFYDQTQWIIDNHDAYRIAGVIHNGDIVDNGNIDSQWAVADQAMSTLEGTSDALPEGMPYGVCVGNHDQSPNGTDNGTTKFNVHFGVERFADKSYYGGHYGSDNDENWVSFEAGGVEFVVVNLQYDTTPDPAVLAWARSIFESHPDAFGILNTHYILGAGGNFGPQGQAIYEALKDVQNVQLFTCGHVAAESRREDTFEGHTIHSMLADYQGRADGGAGFMRIWELSPKSQELTVRSYSPTLDQWETDEDSEFTLHVDLRGFGGSFHEAGVVDPASGHASVALEGLEPGKRYEWYAVVDDCAHVVTTDVMGFTTSP